MTDSSNNPLTQHISYINFAHAIDEKQTNFLMQLCSEIVSKDKSSILYLTLSSTGGSVDYGITLYNFLRALPCIVITHNIGTIDSIANIVYLAGEKRIASLSARFLFHGVFWNPPGGQLLPFEQVSEIHSRLDYDATRIRDILLQRTSLSDEQINAYFLSGKSLTPESAKEIGLVTDIMDLKIQSGCGIFTCNPV